MLVSGGCFVKMGLHGGMMKVYAFVCRFDFLLRLLGSHFCLKM